MLRKSTAAAGGDANGRRGLTPIQFEQAANRQGRGDRTDQADMPPALVGGPALLATPRIDDLRHPRTGLVPNDECVEHVPAGQALLFGHRKRRRQNVGRKMRTLIEIEGICQRPIGQRRHLGHDPDPRAPYSRAGRCTASCSDVVDNGLPNRMRCGG
jgi:hypothetical protein